MWSYSKKLEYPVKIARPNARPQRSSSHNWEDPIATSDYAKASVYLEGAGFLFF